MASHDCLRSVLQMFHQDTIQFWPECVQDESLGSNQLSSILHTFNGTLAVAVSVLKLGIYHVNS